MPGTSEEGSAHSGSTGDSFELPAEEDSGGETPARYSVGSEQIEEHGEASSPQQVGSEIQSAPQSPPLQGSPLFRQDTTEPTEEEQTYEPSLHGPNPCRNKKPTARDDKFCQDECDHKYSTAPPHCGDGPWTIGKCKKTKCTCTFNYKAFKKWVRTVDKVRTLGDPNKLKKLVVKRADKARRGGSSGVVDESAAHDFD